jgi:hypothetical protein
MKILTRISIIIGTVVNLVGCNKEPPQVSSINSESVYSIEKCAAITVTLAQIDGVVRPGGPGQREWDELSKLFGEVAIKSSKEPKNTADQIADEVSKNLEKTLELLRKSPEEAKVWNDRLNEASMSCIRTFMPSLAK